MIWLGYIAGYIVLPLIIFSINDYLHGYYKDRLKYLPSVLHNLDKDHLAVILSFLFWPILTVFIVCVWFVAIVKKLFKEVELMGKLKIYLQNTGERGEARRKKEMDVDLQADKYLLGIKDE